MTSRLRFPFCGVTLNKPIRNLHVLGLWPGQESTALEPASVAAVRVLKAPITTAMMGRVRCIQTHQTAWSKCQIASTIRFLVDICKH